MKIPLPTSGGATPSWLLAPLLLIAYLLYQPGFSGGFIFDDGGSITANEWIQIDRLTPATLAGAASSFHGSPLGRPVAMISFALDHLVAGLDPAQFKRTNLLIHLANGGLVFILASLALEALRRRGVVAPGAALTPRRVRWIALLVAALWVLHPLALTSVLYVVQRMTSLAALFSLAALVLYAWGRLRLLDRRSGWPMILAGVVVATPLAVLSKENALLTPLFMLLMEWFLFGFQCAERRSRRLVVGLFVLLVGVPALCVSAYLLTHPTWITGGYQGRTFTLDERLMTEGRVLWFYLRLILLPSVSAMGVFHDDIPLSRGLLDPSTTIAALVGLVALIGAALAAWRRAPVFAFGVLFFFAGHLMESTVFALELTHEHRNYLPMFGILFAAGYYLVHPAVTAVAARIAAAAVLVAMVGGVTWARVGQWSDPLEQWVAEAAYHPDSPRVQFEMGRTYFFLLQGEASGPARERLAELARAHFSRSYRLSPDYSAGLFGGILLADELGQAPDPREVALLERRLRDFPVSAANTSLLHQLSRCRLAGECSVELSLIRGLYATALENPTLGGRDRSMLLSEAMIHAAIAGDPAAALEAARQALEGDRKTPQHWLNYVNLLIQVGRLEEAGALLEEFKRTRMADWVADRLAMVERLLKTAEASAPREPGG